MSVVARGKDTFQLKFTTVFLKGLFVYACTLSTKIQHAENSNTPVTLDYMQDRQLEQTHHYRSTQLLFLLKKTSSESLVTKSKLWKVVNKDTPKHSSG